MYKTSKLNTKLLLIVVFGVALLTVLVKCAFNSVPVTANSVEDVASFIRSYGWEIRDNPDEIKEITIPAEFSGVYENYNEIQKRQGFDLSKYRTETVTRYTFSVLNFTDKDGKLVNGVYINVLVFDGTIIGGDICTYALDGFMTGFDGKI
jgi:hypothetical protein